MVFLLVLSLPFSTPTLAQTAQSYRQRAIELSRNKSWDQAIASYHKALDLEPNDPDTHYNLALTLKYKGDAKRADAHYALGATWYDLNDQAAALKELRTAVDLDFANAGAHRLLAHIYLQQSNPSAAEGELRRALQSKPSAELHLELGLAEGQLGNLEGAAGEFRRALRLNPKLAPAHSLLGVTLRRKGDHAGALAEFRRAVEIDPKDPEAQLNLGKELKAGGDTTGAIAAFRQAIELKPDFEQAHYNLGIALHAQGETGAAQRELNDLSALQEFRARLAQAKYLILQGVEALKQQKLDDALALFQKSVEQSPELPTGHYYLGVTWERKGDAPRALAAYEKSLELKPDYAQ